MPAAFNDNTQLLQLWEKAATSNPDPRHQAFEEAILVSLYADDALSMKRNVETMDKHLRFVRFLIGLSDTEGCSMKREKATLGILLPYLTGAIVTGYVDEDVDDYGNRTILSSSSLDALLSSAWEVTLGYPFRQTEQQVLPA